MRGTRDYGAYGTGQVASYGVLRVIPPAPSLFHIEAPANDLTPAGMLGGETIVAIRQPVTTIGRNLRNLVVLLDPTVSREHARLLWEDGTWIVENCSAQNPFWVGVQEIAPGERTVIVPGDEFRLGNTVLQLLAPLIPVNMVDIASEEPGQVNFLDPGLTIRFALAGRPARLRVWVIAALVALLLVASALITLGAAVLAGRQALAINGVGGVLAALTIPLVPALGAVLLVGAIDRYEREPVVLLIGAFAWGALIAIPAALYAERQLALWLPSLLSNPRVPTLAATWGPSLLRGVGAGITEETVKGAGLVMLLLALRDEFDNVTDGILYGILIGAGFGMVENFAYFAGSTHGDLGFLILGRVILGWLAHSTFTGLFGAGLGFAREFRSRMARLVAPISGFLAAIVLHSVFDFVDFEATAAAHLPHASRAIATGALVAVLLDYLPLFAAQAFLFWQLLRALRREAATVREYLVSEVSGGVVTPDEYAILQNASLRASIEHQAFFAGGPRAYLTARALHQAAIGLAFRKWHVAMGDRPKAAPRQPEAIYRERIAELRRALLRQLEPHGIDAPQPPTIPLTRA